MRQALVLAVGMVSAGALGLPAASAHHEGKSLRLNVPAVGRYAVTTIGVTSAKRPVLRLRGSIPKSLLYGASVQATYHSLGTYRLTYSASYAGVTRSATLEFKLDAVSDKTTEGGNCSVP